jgi:hypothetical protein
MVDLNAHETGNGGQKPREAYSLLSLLYSESSHFPEPRVFVDVTGIGQSSNVVKG